MSERKDVMLEALHSVLEENPFEEQPQIDEDTENIVTEVLGCFVEVLIREGRAKQDEFGYLECHFTNKDFDKFAAETTKRYIAKKVRGAK